jgi:hypothetical protein
MTEQAQTQGMLETILRKLDSLEKALMPKRAPLTRSQFAEATGYSYRQVTRFIAAKRIRLVADRIPASELDKFNT